MLIKVFGFLYYWFILLFWYFFFKEKIVDVLSLENK